MSTQNLNKSDNSRKAVKLSYSSMTTLQSCEQKYTHYKILETAKDPDYEESDALGIGKSYHAVLEKNLHKSFTDEDVTEEMLANNVAPFDRDLLVTMLKKYIQFREKSGYKIVKCEMPLGTSMYTGFIDFIAVRAGKFYIGDLKTTARYDENILSRLPLDPQLNLYAHFANDLEIAVPEIVGLEFGGCLYNQVTKSKAKTAGGLDSGVKVFETLIPASVMNPDVIWSLFNEVHTRAVELHAGEAPKKNLSSCFNFYSPCQYFSKCHGSTFTDNKNKVSVTTIETLTAIEELL